MNDGDDQQPKRISLKESFDRAAAEAEQAPPWLKAIHEQNREITRVLEARARGRDDHE